MSKTKTDTRFFTNSESDSLYGRFTETLKGAQFFDVLVGYFRTSGFNIMHQQLEQVEKIRILIGLNIDKKGFQFIEEANNFVSHKKCTEDFRGTLKREIDNSEDSIKMETSIEKLVEFIKAKKLEIKIHPSRNIHAKVYITRYHEHDRDFGRVITGSSNFSESGLIAQREFNVELKDSPDVVFALQKFEELWTEGVDVSQDYVDTILNKTWFKITTPYKIYLKFLYEYFVEEIDIYKSDFKYPKYFKELEYQTQAVGAAKRALEKYGGVFLADVVGLGKTYITSLLLQKVEGKKLIICPPVLIDYWEDTLIDFDVGQYKVESLGKIEQLRESGKVDEYKYVIIDEAHRFRNEMTGGYEALHGICVGKKVILVSATPLNNKLEDINAQIKLFQPAKNSSVPGVKDLDYFFNNHQKKIKKHNKDTDEYSSALRQASKAVREKILRHVMVRRTRSEIVKYFSGDIGSQGIVFPEVTRPQRVIYEYADDMERVFNETIILLKKLSYARYTPLLFLKEGSGAEAQAQRNLSGFMKGILVKRLESSFFAFRNTLGRFIESYEKFIDMYEGGTVWVSKKVNVFDLLEQDDMERLEALFSVEKVDRYPSEDFKPEYKDELEEDLKVLRAIHDLWETVDSDPKIEKFIDELKNNPILSGRKILIFSEAKDTVEYLQAALEKHFPNKVLSYSSSGGIYQQQSYSGKSLRKVVEKNYDPNSKQQDDDVSILITTDVLAEGVNLHRSNVIINYDLPWNPTRVLQRVGRVNRVGTTHDKIHIFNFFPTAQSDEHLGLEVNIKNKLQSFHHVMGEDAQYLSEDEVVSAHELFERLDDKVFSENEEGEDAELPYLQVIRGVRDKDPKLFEDIKSLSKKARSGRKESSISEDSLLTFFRRGYLREFVKSDEINSEKLEFSDVAALFACEPDTKSVAFNKKSFYKLLQANKDYLAEQEQEADKSAGWGGSTNEAQLLARLKADRNEQTYTAADEEYHRQASFVIEQGRIPRKTVKGIIQELKGGKSEQHLLSVLREKIHPAYLTITDADEDEAKAKEVVLSLYMSSGKQ